MTGPSDSLLGVYDQRWSTTPADQTHTLELMT